MKILATILYKDMPFAEVRVSVFGMEKLSDEDTERIKNRVLGALSDEEEAIDKIAHLYRKEFPDTKKNVSNAAIDAWILSSFTVSLVEEKEEANESSI